MISPSILFEANCSNPAVTGCAARETDGKVMKRRFHTAGIKPAACLHAMHLCVYECASTSFFFIGALHLCVCVLVCLNRTRCARHFHTSSFHLASKFNKYFNWSQFPVKCHYSVSAHMHGCKVPQLIGLHFREIISDC